MPRHFTNRQLWPVPVLCCTAKATAGIRALACASSPPLLRLGLGLWAGYCVSPSGFLVFDFRSTCFAERCCCSPNASPRRDAQAVLGLCHAVLCALHPPCTCCHGPNEDEIPILCQIPFHRCAKALGDKIVLGPVPVLRLVHCQGHNEDERPMPCARSTSTAAPRPLDWLLSVGPSALCT